MSKRKQFIYIVITDNKIYSIKSSSKLDINSKVQLDWLIRTCNGVKPKALIEVTRENSTMRLLDAIDIYMVCI